ncbi:MAG: hypothetical protein K0S65_5937 [Labilithrix sp.]|nr:hypothetical protein [Labilithrix sp.]
MRRIYYVMPVGDVWLLRDGERAPEVFPTFEEALAAAGRLMSRGSVVRVIGRAEEASKGRASTTASAPSPTRLHPTY